MTSAIADILIVDDTPENLRLLTGMLQNSGYRPRPVPSGKLALAAIEKDPPDLILLDINMPEMSGYEVCEALKADPRFREIPVIFISALGDTVDKLTAFSLGGVDYVSKPFQFAEVEARVRTHVKLRTLQRALERHNLALAETVRRQVREISDSQHATIFALAKLSEARDEDTGAHLFRVRMYCKALAERLAARRDFAGAIDAAFIENIYSASPMHDIGKVSIPDAVLLKRGPLTDDEWVVMRAHTTLGATTLEAVLTEYPHNEFVRMGVDIARCHHERWDGTGYPNGLAGEAIPLAARIFNIVDQYDALRSARPYKPAFTHEKTVEILEKGDGRTRPEHFDPRVLAVFPEVVDDFAKIWDGYAS